MDRNISSLKDAKQGFMGLHLKSGVKDVLDYFIDMYNKVLAIAGCTVIVHQFKEGSNSVLLW